MKLRHASIKLILHLILEKYLRYPLEIYKNCKLHELRYLNTRICLKLSKELINEYSVKGIINSVQQKKEETIILI